MNNFSGKEEIIRSLRPVVSDFKFVAVNDKVLDEFCSRIRPKHIPHPDWNAPVIYGGLDETGIDYFLVMNSINFCFWGDPKWTVEYRGRSYDGAFGMFAALTRALEEGHPIYDGAYLAKLSKTDLAHILRGNVPIPLLEPRLGILRDIGRGLAGRWGGRFSRMVAEVGGSAVALVGLLTEQFPSFNDSVPWGEGRLIFHKRAQLAPAMINERWRGKGIGAFRDIDRLTVSADYKLPQVLRRTGILEYVPSLAQRIDENRRIPANSREEIEIRAATIMAGEMMREKIARTIPSITSQDVDRFLWLVGQTKTGNEKPYHKTLTTAY
ncbi:MAG TPA: queuosine salvage family protein [bacterium]|nr:queuosine salvage family protein [bacterium]HPQ66984.1 queuosine salvage family protein [bacterium]